MQFKFVGQGPKDHKTLEPFVAFGVIFSPGKYSEVVDEIAVEKLKNNPHFVSENGNDNELEELRALAREKGIERVGVKSKDKLLAELEALDGDAS